MQPSISRKALIYCRTTIQNKDMETQGKSCRDYAKENDHHVIGAFTDNGISGNSASRPALDKMLSALDQFAKENTAVIIENHSRLARDLKLFFQLSKAIKNKNAELIIVSDHSYQKLAG